MINKDKVYFTLLKIFMRVKFENYLNCLIFARYICYMQETNDRILIIKFIPKTSEEVQNTIVCRELV